MSVRKALTVELSDDMDRVVRSRIASGEYATEGDVIRAGLRSLEERDAVDDWLATEVARTYDDFRRDPGRAIPAETVLARLEARFATMSGDVTRDAQG